MADNKPLNDTMKQIASNVMDDECVSQSSTASDRTQPIKYVVFDECPVHHTTADQAPAENTQSKQLKESTKQGVNSSGCPDKKKHKLPERNTETTIRGYRLSRYLSVGRIPIRRPSNPGYQVKRRNTK
jgi:hypothetical protein